MGLLIPSIENRLQAMLEARRRSYKDPLHRIPVRPTVTITREFGCEGFPVAEKLQALLEEKTGVPWTVMDKELLAAVARDHHLSEELFANISTKNRFLDDMLSTFSPRWKSEKDYYRLLCRQIIALAQAGNVIIVGRGAAILTQSMQNCYHFRIVAPTHFKVHSIMKRLNLNSIEAEDLISKRQHQRDAFLKDFLGRDVTDPTLYHLIFNNARNNAQRIATIIASYLQHD